MIETRIGSMTDEEILDAKVEILRLLSDGVVKTIAEAARAINLSPARVYNWSKSDKDFRELMSSVYEVIADDIEKGFIEGKDYIPKMMLLKGYRPRFRDNYKFEFSTEKIENFLQELKEIGQNPKQKDDDEV